MADFWSPDDNKEFEQLWAKFTMQELPPPSCQTRFCKKPLGASFYTVVHGTQSSDCCSMICALKLSKEREKISHHIKVGKMNPKKK